MEYGLSLSSESSTNPRQEFSLALAHLIDDGDIIYIHLIVYSCSDILVRTCHVSPVVIGIKC